MKLVNTQVNHSRLRTLKDQIIQRYFKITKNKSQFRTLFDWGLLLLMLTACNDPTRDKKSKKQAISLFKGETLPISKHGINSEENSQSCNCPSQFDLKDSSLLIHVRNQFYKSKTGHLYEKTVGIKEMNGHLIDNEYFNGYFSQKVDPLTFEPLEGWYAKDINNVYYYKPLSGGMQISMMGKADVKTFKLLAGHYRYAVDKNHYYDGLTVMAGFSPSKTKHKLDSKGAVAELTCNKKRYKLEL